MKNAISGFLKVFLVLLIVIPLATNVFTFYQCVFTQHHLLMMKNNESMGWLVLNQGADNNPVTYGPLTPDLNGEVVRFMTILDKNYKPVPISLPTFTQTMTTSPGAAQVIGNTKIEPKKEEIKK